jgi:hypothetical protein
VTKRSWWCRLVHRFLRGGWESATAYYPDCGFFSAYTVTRYRCRTCGRCYTTGREPAHQM